MNPKHQQFLSDEWQPPNREIQAVTLFGSDHAEIAKRGSPETGIRAEELIMLEDMQ